MDEFIKFSGDYPFVMMHLPDKMKEIKKFPRQYLINIIHTKLGEKFRHWVDDRVNQRHNEIKEKQKMFIELDPEVAKILKESNAVSTTNGTSYQLFKASAKRRRTKEEIKEQELREAAEKMEIEIKLKKFAEMEQQIAEQQAKLQSQDVIANHT